MKKLITPLFLLVLLLSAQVSIAQRWTQRVDSIFRNVNRSLVSTGLLTNYGFALKDYNQFQGTTRSSSNRLQLAYARQA